MHMIPKNDCISILSTGLAYAFSGYYSGSEVDMWQCIQSCDNVAIIISWKHSNCVFVSFAKLVTSGFFIGQSDDFCLPATALDLLANTIFSLAFLLVVAFEGSSPVIFTVFDGTIKGL